MSLASTSVNFTAVCTMPTLTISTFIYYNVPLLALALLFVLHYLPVPKIIKHVPLRLTKTPQPTMLCELHHKTCEIHIN
jgi:hypothetical protein